MIKYMILTLLIGLNALADISVTCKSNCPVVTGVTVVSSAPSQEVLKVTPLSLENIEVKTAGSAAKKRLVVEIDENSEAGNINIDLSSKLDSIDKKIYDSSNGLIVGSFINSVSLNTSGYIGAKGKSSSDICYEKIMDGSYDTAVGSGTEIKDNFTSRRSTDPSLPAAKCDSVDIDFIKTKISSAGTSAMCSPGYTVDPLASSSSTFSLRRISKKRACINNPTVGRICKFKKHVFQCGFGLGSQYGMNVTQINGDGVYPTIYWAVKRVYAPYFVARAYPSGGTDIAGLNTYLDNYQSYSCHNECYANTKIDGWVDNMIIQTLGERYYEERHYDGDCSSESCTVDQFRRSSLYLRAQNYCAQWDIGFGTGCYGNSQGECVKGANWVSGWPGTRANGFYLGLQTIDDISSSSSESCEELGVRKGYSPSHSAYDMGPAISAETTWIPEANTCADGFTNAGTYNDFSTCTDGDTAALCDGGGDEDSTLCSSSSCEGAKMISNNRSYAPITSPLGEGEKGSRHGSISVFIFQMKGTATSTAYQGSDGDNGSEDLNIVGEKKVCKMIEDEDYFDSLTADSKAASKVASYRSLPRIFIDNVDFKPLDTYPVPQVKTTYPTPKPDQNKVFTHVDNNVRKLILRESQ